MIFLVILTLVQAQAPNFSWQVSVLGFSELLAYPFLCGKLGGEACEDEWLQNRPTSGSSLGDGNHSRVVVFLKGLG